MRVFLCTHRADLRFHLSRIMFGTFYRGLTKHICLINPQFMRLTFSRVNVLMRISKTRDIGIMRLMYRTTEPRAIALFQVKKIIPIFFMTYSCNQETRLDNTSFSFSLTLS